jgi:hypothetical protein
MKKTLRLIGFGVLIWLIPFVISFGFYDANGNLTTSYDLFKSCMIVISTLVGCYFLYRYFSSVVEHFAKEGAITGITWLLINLVLDFIILVPFAKMELKDYIVTIGIRYLQIPIITYITGRIVERKLNSGL